MISKTQMAEWRKLAERATPGRWSSVSDLPAFAVACDKSDICPSKSRLYRQKNLFRQGHWGVRESDAAFIAASREAVPLLLDALEVLTKAIERDQKEYGACALGEVLKRVYAPESEEKE